MYATQTRNEIWLDAITQWEKLLGKNAVLIKQDEIAPYTKNTIGVNRNIKGVLLPRSTEDVQCIVRIAKQCKTPLYPISGGKNWGYGSCSPVKNTSFIVDLSNMKKISDFDPELGVVTVEPGVTQQDLFEFFKNNGNLFMVPTTGAGPSASILGNALERGYGLTPHSDHFDAITSFHAVLPSGDLYIPALEELGGKKINQLFKWGLGPYLDGLFTQGNFGIVTEGTLLVAHRPESIATFFFSLKDDASLEGAIKAIRTIKKELGNNTGAINLMNARRVLSMMEPFPEENCSNNQVITDEVIAQLTKKHQLTEWTGFGAIYGKKEITKVARNIIKKTLKPYIKRINFFTENTIKTASLIRFVAPSFYKKILKPKLDILSSALQNVSGVPSQVALPLAYWRSGKTPDRNKVINPAQDNCGLIWHAPLVPLTPKDIRKHVEIVNKVCPQHNINPLITLTIFSEQCCDSTIPILFDKNDIKDQLNAKECHNSLIAQEAKEGYLPYRLGIDKMNELIDPEKPCWKFAKQLKLAVDPDQIIAPGRYIPNDTFHENKKIESIIENNVVHEIKSRERRSNLSQALNIMNRNNVSFKEKNYELTKEIKISIANNIEDRIQAYKLLYTVYVEKEFARVNKSKMWYSKFDADPDTVTLVAKKGDDILGAITIIKDTGKGLPADDIYKGDLDEKRRKGNTFSEIVSLGIDKNIRGAQNVLVSLFNQAYFIAKSIHLSSHFIITVNPKHTAFYKRKLLFETLGQRISYGKVGGADAELLSLEFQKAEQEVRKIEEGSNHQKTLYKIFKTADQANGQIKFLRSQIKPMDTVTYNYLFRKDLMDYDKEKVV
ncbi:MAG: hypothetical protein COA79_17900 [Planctomycetota bacterium]|nr:MAG: hypothetical protein COA79_17900 [Planctomycetota bacterium]